MTLARNALFCFLVLLFWNPSPGSTQAPQSPLPNGSTISWIAKNEAQEKISASISEPFEGRYFFLAKAGRLPNANSSAQIFTEQLETGIYFISSAQYPTAGLMHDWGLEQIAPLKMENKLEAQLLQKQFPVYAFAPDGRKKVRVLIAKGVDARLAQKAFREGGFIPQERSVADLGVYEFWIMESELEKLATLPFVQYVEAGKPEPQILNKTSRAISRSYSLNAPVADGGRGLNGEGITVGVGDDADPTLHPDLYDRILNHTPGIVNAHGAHTAGSIAGAGIIDPQFRGYAPLALVVSDWFGGIWSNASRYFSEYRMVITNNSYGSVVGECAVAGAYDLDSRMLDELAWKLPAQLHVFAAGNDGQITCSGLPQSYGTILSGYQSAKNNISVGRTIDAINIGPSSSSGPTRDGRIKPEIMAYGTNVRSLNGNFSMSSPYVDMTGTSMAAPQVVGGLTLLYERYRQLNNNADPRGDLVKALLLNGAYQPRGPGPDYRFGFGVMHLENSLRMLESKNYEESQIAHGQTQEFRIDVPAQTGRLKVMLYWHDLPGSIINPKTLVNDLNLTVTSPGGQKQLPLILKNDSASVRLAPVQGEDHINNAEQVVINEPATGQYTISINAKNVIGNLQPFVVVYDFLPAGIKLSNPVNKSAWNIADVLPVTWDYTGDDGTGFTLEYSLDGGNTWKTISENIAAAERIFQWRPDTSLPSNDAQLRIRRNGTAHVGVSGKFTLIRSVVSTLAPAEEQCRQFMKIKWTPVTGATGYRVMLKMGPVMQPVADLSQDATTFTLRGLNPDSTYYAAVLPLLGQRAGWWSKAVQHKPDYGNCTGIYSDGDLALAGGILPSAGRQFTSTSLSNFKALELEIANKDDEPIKGFELNVWLDGIPMHFADTATIHPGSSKKVEIKNLDLSQPKLYDFIAIVKNLQGTDNNPYNDTLRHQFRQLANLPFDLSAPLFEGFEQMPRLELLNPEMGFGGNTRWDYQKDGTFDRLRTAATPDVPLNGNRAITLDAKKAEPTNRNPYNRLIGNYNLSSYNTQHAVRMDFWFAQHGELTNDAKNRFAIRGSDQDNWIDVVNFYDLQNRLPGVYTYSQSLDIARILADNNQVFTSSFQARFGQKGAYSMSDPTRFSGISFDNIRLYLAKDDIQLKELASPAPLNCGLTENSAITVKIRNSMAQAISNIPVKYRIDNGPIISEIIPNIPANSDIQFTFNQKASFTQLKEYGIIIWSDLVTDNVKENDTLHQRIRNQPLITASPYFENFELNDGNWFAEGINSSWQYGTPQSLRLQDAASGEKVWTTNLEGNYNDNENSYLYSPCINIAALTNPSIAFAFTEDIEDCSSISQVCDHFWLEYSGDGQTWTKLGRADEGLNWYRQAYQSWYFSNRNYWKAAMHELPSGLSQIRLRFAFRTDVGTSRNGIALDDIHVYSNQPMYQLAPTTTMAMTEPVTKSISGDQWHDFSTQGALIISINPGINNIPQVTVQGFDSAQVRQDGRQYYLPRSYTIKTGKAEVYTDPVKVRLYFRDADMEAMRQAIGCAGCKPPVDYTHMNITRYTDIDPAKEDGLLANNNSGSHSTISNDEILFVPYDKGYYAEFEVHEFSEFYITDGGFTYNPAARFTRVEAVQSGSANRVTWEVFNEFEVDQYSVEVSLDAGRNFQTVHTVKANNTNVAVYEFSDAVNFNKVPVLIYRIQRKDKSGRLYYSIAVQIQNGANNFFTVVYPNPVQNELTIEGTSIEHQLYHYLVTDIAGRQVMLGKFDKTGGRFTEKISLSHLMPGYYFLRVSSNGGTEVHKIIKVN